MILTDKNFLKFFPDSCARAAWFGCIFELQRVLALNWGRGRAPDLESDLPVRTSYWLGWGWLRPVYKPPGVEVVEAKLHFAYLLDAALRRLARIPHPPEVELWPGVQIYVDIELSEPRKLPLVTFLRFWVLVAKLEVENNGDEQNDEDADYHDQKNVRDCECLGLGLNVERDCL